MGRVTAKSRGACGAFEDSSASNETTGVSNSYNPALSLTIERLARRG